MRPLDLAAAHLAQVITPCPGGVARSPGPASVGPAVQSTVRSSPTSTSNSGRSASVGGPLAASRGGCAAAAYGFGGAPHQCPGRVEWTGLVWFESPAPGEVWKAFACDGHRDQLVAARPLEDRDRVELQRRRDKHQAGLEGRPWAPDRPLAVGPDARRLLDRAKDWAKRSAAEDTTQQHVGFSDPAT